MNVATPGLIIDVEARITKLERGLKQANDRQRRAADEMERRAKQSADKINDTYGKMTNGIGASFGKLGKLALPFAGGLLAGVAAGGVAGIVGNLDRVAEGMANIGNEAERAGLSSQAFQELGFVAQQNRIGVDALTDGVKELNLRADEFIMTGQGSGAEAFARLGYSVDDLKTKLKDPSDLFVEIIGRLKDLDKAAQIRVMDEIFGGTGGEQFGVLIGQGEAKLRETIQTAHDVGAVLDDELIAKAAEIDRKFGELTTRVSSFGKRAVVEIAAMGIELADFRDRLDRLFDNEAQGRSILGNEVYDALAADRDAVNAQAEALARLDERYSALSEEAARAGMSMAGAIGQLDSWGYDAAADSLRNAHAEMDELTRSFRDGEITGEEFSAKLGDIQTAAQAAFAELEAGDRTSFNGVISQLDRLGGVISGVISLAASMKAAIASAAGVSPDQRDAAATDRANAAAAAAMAQTRANDAFTESENARNTATTEQLHLEREVAAVRDRAASAGATLTDTQATDAAQAVIAADAARQAIDQAARAADRPARGGGAGDRAGGGTGAAKVDDFAREAQAIRDKTAALQIESAVLLEVATSQRQHGDAVAFAEVKTRLLIAAQTKGQAVTPAQITEIDALADAYARAGVQAEDANEKMTAKARDAAENLKAGTAGLAEVFGAARQGADALSSTLSRIGDQIIDNVFQQAIMALAGGGGPANGVIAGFGRMLTGGYAEGGFTGPGAKYQPAGIVHAGEFVLSQEAVRNIGVDNLDRLHRAAKSGAVGYATGGAVGAAGKLIHATSDSLRASGAASAPPITINAPVTVNASSGTPEQNADLAAQMARESEQMMRGIIQQEMVRQLRPGGLMR